ncbi:putative developmental regulator, ULTRAPETALA [Helianthus anomalus]
MMTPSLLFAIAMIPAIEFAKHAYDGRNVPKWRTKVLVLNCNSEKIKLGKHVFLDIIKEMDMWTCENIEERSLRRHSGCRRNSKYTGCKDCVCFGCQMCRFEDCGCMCRFEDFSRKM